MTVLKCATGIRRGFVDLPHGQVHYRHAGPADADRDMAEPVLLLHGSPGSSRQLHRLIAGLAPRARVLAPDTPGNGDSAALPHAAPAIADLAVALLAFMDRVGIARAHVYGTHTGAAIATELAILAPQRVVRVVLDGVGAVEPGALNAILAQYAPSFAPDLDGACLIRAFQFCRDQFLFYPWYDRVRAARRDSGLPDAADLYALLVEVLKAGETYGRNYHAAFTWPAPERLPLLPCPVRMMAAHNDPLVDTTRALAAVLPGDVFHALPRYDDPDFANRQRAAILAHFADNAP